ncbi:MAG TPA: hypothetical protein VFT50_14025 [Baekduia sp.]|nr:hypothetical protein [Baekduia sp.]
MRPLDLGETFDAAFGIVRERWRTLVVVMAVVAVPVELLSLLVTALTTDRHDVASGGLLTGTDYGSDGAGLAGGAIVATLAIVGYLLGTVACYRAVTDTYAGRETSAEASLRFAGERLGPALWLMILILLGLVAGFLACVVPGVWLAIAWSVAMPVLLVEGRHGVPALRRSAELVRDRWWATFGKLFVAYVLALVASGVVSAVLTTPVSVAAGSDSFAALAVQHLASALTSLVTTPFVAAVTALVYFDLRARKEGFDPRDGGTPAPSGGEPPARGPWLPPVPPA